MRENEKNSQSELARQRVCHSTTDDGIVLDKAAFAGLPAAASIDIACKKASRKLKTMIMRVACECKTTHRPDDSHAMQWNRDARKAASAAATSRQRLVI
ncbi:hypothetical protein [Burkholderia plantarii]|uniref:hypothetical protein n=1 Tax=Burkholderia plantarii TaxID=41899 RepID=UPI000AEC502D|nr:hypothetical protein [Burkholderia plantarii]